MSSGERPMGAAKGKQSDTEALCHPPPPPKRAPEGEQTLLGIKNGKNNNPLLPTNTPPSPAQYNGHPRQTLCTGPSPPRRSAAELDAVVASIASPPPPPPAVADDVLQQLEAGFQGIVPVINALLGAVGTGGEAMLAAGGTSPEADLQTRLMAYIPMLAEMRNTLTGAGHQVRRPWEGREVGGARPEVGGAPRTATRPCPACLARIYPSIRGDRVGITDHTSPTLSIYILSTKS